MLQSRRARLWVMLAALSAGALFQFGPSGCADYWATTGFSTLNFCAVLNCEGGTFFNVCDPIPLFVDCPNYNPQTP